MVSSALYFRLVDAKADVHVRDQYGYTPLFYYQQQYQLLQHRLEHLDHGECNRVPFPPSHPTSDLHSILSVKLGAKAPQVPVIPVISEEEPSEAYGTHSARAAGSSQQPYTAARQGSMARIIY